MANTIKTFLLMAGLTVFLMWLGDLMGGRQVALIALVVAIGVNFYSYWFSDRLVLKRYRAVEIGPEDHPRLYRTVADLAARARLPMPKVYLLPQDTPNAFATGRNPKHAAVAATRGILRLLDGRELAGVMAHELAHVKHRDILTGTVAAGLAGAVGLLLQFGGMGMGGGRRRVTPLGMMILMIAAPLAAIVVRMAVSRVREYAADEESARLTGEPLALASALDKLQRGVEEHPLQEGNPAHSHLFIVNPFLGGLQKLFSSHPPTPQRIERLQEIDRQYRGARQEAFRRHA